ncbi:hypothetical protein EJ05DRAFT_478399 [Pseudovirgaria hyperparasitica]|uniref:Heterokaryon incompatibility domain-containing protein n=1 Tax=Pseudovirgaria hyperparasitica TaxID=470096 RepID=A0A6A6W072_9PEZI|nr:uncharacterized protein EJ05DRAFT_478399 [Pseudovirgaria hyperparasitica]KAF2755384.1 hypothetical protein EJ05DRAFT_478399 [Pseudovirgaria hyperparasitica]
MAKGGSFYTPDNKVFYSTHRYDTIDPTHQAIRLIELSPKSRNGLLDCRLLPAKPLRKLRHKYVTLSYCAGSPNSVHPMLVNGIPFNAFANLGHALEQVLLHWKQHKFGKRHARLRIWIDQICINQVDIAERSHQVSFMRKTYEHSYEVLICLSTPLFAPRPYDKFEHFHHMTNARKAKLFERALLKREMDSDDLFSGHYMLPLVQLQSLGFLYFSELFKAPWWRRGWVYQEFITSRRACFMYLGFSISWKDLQKVSAAMDELSSSFRLKSYCQQQHGQPLIPLSLFDTPGFEEEVSHALKQHHCAACCLYEAYSRWDVENESYTYMFFTKSRWKNSIDIVSLLVGSMLFLTSDPRDQMFAFIGLADSRYNFAPDYAASLPECILQVSKEVWRIGHERDLLGLATETMLRSQFRDDLPSWAPDWTVRGFTPDRVTLTVNGHFLKAYSYKYVAFRRRSDTISFLGYVMERTKAIFRSVSPDPYAALARAPRGRVDGSTLLISGYFIDVIESTQLHISGRLPDDRNPLNCTSEFLGSYDLKLPRPLDPIRRALEGSKGTDEPKYDAAASTSDFRVVQRRIDRIRACPGRRLAEPASASLQLCRTKADLAITTTSDVQPGDQVWLIAGSGVAKVLRSTDKDLKSTFRVISNVWGDVQSFRQYQFTFADDTMDRYDSDGRFTQSLRYSYFIDDFPTQIQGSPFLMGDIQQIGLV